MKKKYEVEHAGVSMIVEIDHSVLSDERLHEFNDFWTNPKNRLSDSNGDITETVLRLLMKDVYLIQAKNNYTTEGVVEEFNWDKNRGIEGWVMMDGSNGIKIISVDEFEFDDILIGDMGEIKND